MIIDSSKTLCKQKHNSSESKFTLSSDVVCQSARHCLSDVVVCHSARLHHLAGQDVRFDHESTALVDARRYPTRVDGDRKRNAGGVLVSYVVAAAAVRRSTDVTFAGDQVHLVAATVRLHHHAFRSEQSAERDPKLENLAADDYEADFAVAVVGNTAASAANLAIVLLFCLRRFRRRTIG